MSKTFMSAIKKIFLKQTKAIACQESVLNPAQMVSTFASTFIRFYRKAMLKPFATPF